MKHTPEELQAIIAATPKNQSKAYRKLDTLSKKSYQEIANYIDTNVTDLASAKTVLTKLAQLLKAIIER